jgi:hypothetical protein
MNMYQLPNGQALDLDRVATVSKLENNGAFYRVDIAAPSAFGVAGSSFIIAEKDFSRADFLKLLNCKLTGGIAEEVKTRGISKEQYEAKLKEDGIKKPAPEIEQPEAKEQKKVK